jgi:hypothetical protein
MNKINSNEKIKLAEVEKDLLLSEQKNSNTSK